MKILSAHQMQFIPWLGFFSKIKSCHRYVILDNLKYSALSLQTRNKIKNNSLNMWTWLIIPVNKDSANNLFSNVLIDPKNKIWKTKHLKTLRQSYSKAKFFEEIYSDIENIYKSEDTYLSKFIYKFIQYALDVFQIKTEIFFQSALQQQGFDSLKKKSELLLDLTKFLDCNCFLFGSNAKKYFNIEQKKIFEKNNVKFLFQSYKHPKYIQIYDRTFQPNLSFLDLLFNCGKKNSGIYLDKSETVEDIS